MQQRESELEQFLRESRRDAHIQAAYELHDWGARMTATDPMEIILLLELELENDNE